VALWEALLKEEVVDCLVAAPPRCIAIPHFRVFAANILRVMQGRTAFGLGPAPLVPPRDVPRASEAVKKSKLQVLTSCIFNKLHCG
jgi:hypothetical protein